MKNMMQKTAILATMLILFLTAASIINFNTKGEPAEPPQAAFAYSPAKPYLNMTITFDASFSSPE